MKYKFLLGAMLLGGTFSALADGYTDGIDYYNAGQYANARTILNRTLNDASTDKALAYYYLGQIELLYKNNAEAKADFEKGIQANPSCPFNYVGLGAYNLNSGNLKEAQNNFKEAEKYGKKNAKVAVEIARAYYNNDPENAENLKTVRKYIDKARKDSKNQEPSIYILEGDIILGEGNSEVLGDAAAQYEMAISYDNDNPEGYVKYAKVYKINNPEFGVAKLEELLSKQPNSALAQRELAERYYATNQWQKAVPLYGEYMNNPNHFPEDKARYSFLLWVYKDYEKANQIADEILAEDPNNFQAQRIKMLSQSGLKNYEATLEAANKLFANTGSGNEYTQTDYLTYAGALDELKKYDEAIAAYQKALELSPNNPSTLTSLAFAYSSADRNQEAAETLAKAIECTENPTLTHYMRSAGMWLYAAGDAKDEAVKIADAEKGLECINKVIDTTSQVTPDMLRRKAQLLQLKYNGEITPEVGQAYEALVAALDADPANMDPANKKLGWYEAAFRVLNKYYENDKDKQDSNLQRYSEVVTLLGK